MGSTSGSGVDTEELIEPSGPGSCLGIGSMTMSLLSTMETICNSEMPGSPRYPVKTKIPNLKKEQGARLSV